MKWGQVCKEISNILRRPSVFTVFILFITQVTHADTIIIDPGHGGPNANQNYNGDNSTGTYGPAYGLSEQWVNLEIAMLLYNQLDNWVVHFTRDEQDPDPAPSPQWRADFANNYVGTDDVVIFVSIHHNSSPDNPDSNIQGTETLWCENNSTEGVSESEKKALAEAIQPKLVSAFGYNDRRVKEDYSANPAQGHLTVLKKTEIIAALTEASFLDTYDEEENMLFDPSHLKAEATAIKDGVNEYAATIEIDPYWCEYPPDIPTNLSEYDQYYNGLMIRWDEATNANYYEVHRSTTSGFTPSNQTLIGTEYSNMYFDEGLAQPAQYYYKVRGVSDCGVAGDPSDDFYGAFSSQLSVYFDPPPAPPSNLILNSYKHRCPYNGFQIMIHPKLVWDANQESDLASSPYKVYSRINGGNWSNIATTSSTTHTDHWVNITPGPHTIDYVVTASDLQNQQSLYSNMVSTTTQLVSRLLASNNIVPDNYIMPQNYPNPFNPITTITYGLPENSNVSLVIYDILGREVITLINKQQTAGSYSVQWNGKDNYGNIMSTGMYFYVLEAQSLETNQHFKQTHKMVLIR